MLTGSDLNSLLAISLGEGIGLLRRAPNIACVIDLGSGCICFVSSSNDFRGTITIDVIFRGVTIADMDFEPCHLAKWDPRVLNIAIEFLFIPTTSLLLI